MTALFVRAQRGDRAAYSTCLQILTGLLRRYVRGRAGDVPWIDDVVQETLLSIHAARHTYDAQRAFAPWFYAIAKHRTIDGHRRQCRIGEREIGMDRVPEPISRTADVIEAAPLLAAMQRLPARQREVIAALKLRDESARAIGARLGMTEGAVKVTAHRGYKALRRFLGKT